MAGCLTDLEVLQCLENVVLSIGRLIDGTYYATGTCTLLNKQNLLVTAAHVVNCSNEYLLKNFGIWFGYSVKKTKIG